MHQVGYYADLLRDARSTEYKKSQISPNKLLCPTAFEATHFKYTVVPTRQMGCIYEPAFI